MKPRNSQDLPRDGAIRARVYVGTAFRDARRSYQLCGPYRRGPEAPQIVERDAAELRRVRDSLLRISRETSAILRERSR